MKDYADRNWLLNEDQPATKTGKTIIIMTIGVIAFMMLLFMVVTGFIDLYPPIVVDTNLSPDRASFIESGNAPLVIREEDTH